MACDIFYADNNNPLDWGCTVSTGTTTRILYTIGAGGSGYTIYLVKTDTINPVTITMNAHGTEYMTILGIK